MTFAFIRHFIKLESASGILLFFATCVAIILSNSPWSNFYQELFAYSYLTKPVLFWINEGLMTFFFLLVSLELRREFIGQGLSDISKFALPGVAALGGMIAPIIIFIVINYNHPETLKGWAIPVATDIAFVLGVLSLFGKRIPIGLKLFLMALAIFDDVGAIIIIAVFHTKSLSILALAGALLVIIFLQILNRYRVKQLSVYLLGGLILWICTLKSGVHPTIAGVILAFLIPQSDGKNVSPSRRLETMLHPWVAFLIMPIFALAVAGVSLEGLEFKIIFDYVSLGIILGLVIGKQIGVFSFTWLSIRLGLDSLPKGVTWYEIWAIALLCGIGFTMSLFLGTLAFEENKVYLTEVRLGILIGSMLSGLIGAGILYSAIKMKRGMKIEAS